MTDNDLWCLLCDCTGCGFETLWLSFCTCTVLQFIIMATIPITISQEDFNTFHSIDRTLYNLLVTDLCRDPMDSMRVMALWLWLERAGFRNVVKKVLSVSSILINELADEALACIHCINGTPLPFSSETIGIPLTQSLMKKDISLQFFRENQSTAAQGMVKAYNEVCVRALTDIMEAAIGRNHLGFVAEKEMVQTREITVPPDDRTMFVTFSKGYPVEEWEVRYFFNSVYGNCIESFDMQEVMPDEQVLFARIVFTMPSIIDVTLNGQIKAKLTINGKQVWMRKFVPKRRASVPPA